VFNFNENVTPKTIKFDKKKGAFNSTGSIIQILEKDLSTYSKKDISGVAFSWGQNTGN
jgi:hypothetical protein